MSDNKVVIKINYDKNRPAKPKTQPQMVTVWHTRRILVAAITLVLIIAVLYSWLSDNDQTSDTQIEPALKVPATEKSDVDSVESQAPAVLNKTAPATLPVLENHQESIKKAEMTKKPAAIIFNRSVIRASLNGKPKDNEPGEPIKLPLRLAATQSAELFYFSEIKNMKGQLLFHQWRRNGQIVYQKQLDIKEPISKVWSSKTLSAKDKGEWQVQLADKKAKVYSEVNFMVNPE